MTGAELKAIRQGLKLSQARLAQLLGVSKRAVALWEGGYRKVPPLLVTVFRYMTPRDVEAYQKR